MKKDQVLFIVSEEPIVRNDNAQNVEIKEDIATKYNFNNAPHQIQNYQVPITNSKKSREQNDSSNQSLINDKSFNKEKQPPIDINNILIGLEKP